MRRRVFSSPAAVRVKVENFWTRDGRARASCPWWCLVSVGLRFAAAVVALAVAVVILDCSLVFFNSFFLFLGWIDEDGVICAID